MKEPNKFRDVNEALRELLQKHGPMAVAEAFRNALDSKVNELSNEDKPDKDQIRLWNRLASAQCTAMATIARYYPETED